MLDYAQLQALLAVREAGSFEKAAKNLGITPIGVASRVKKLEKRMGAKLLLRKPTRPSQAGDLLCDYTNKITRLETELLKQQRINAVQSDMQKPTLKIAITDHGLIDCLSKGLASLKTESTDHYRIVISSIGPQDAYQAIKTGRFVAAVTNRKCPAFGFKSHSLGTVVYKAVASPEFIQRQFGNHSRTLDQISPSLCNQSFGNGGLCYEWLYEVFGETKRIKSQTLPTTSTLIEVCSLGLGWSLLPEHLIRAELSSGKLIELIPDKVLEKEVYWHIAQFMNDELMPLTNAFKKATNSMLKNHICNHQ